MCALVAHEGAASSSFRKQTTKNSQRTEEKRKKQTERARGELREKKTGKRSIKTKRNKKLEGEFLNFSN